MRLGADLRGARLEQAHLSGADLTKAGLAGAYLRGAHLREAILREAFLSGALLTEADLTRANRVNTDLEHAVLTGCRIYGISAWDVHLDGAKQTGLVITPEDTAEITVDDLEVAQFVYLLLNNVKIRKVIDTITSKVVLILGRFTPERKIVLDRLRDTLRSKNYSPVVFDF